MTEYIPSQESQQGRDERAVKQDAEASRKRIADILKVMDTQELPDKLRTDPATLKKLEDLLIGYPYLVDTLFGLEEKDLRNELKRKSEEEQKTRKKPK